MARSARVPLRLSRETSCPRRWRYGADAVADLATELEPFARSLLRADEELLGACIGSEQRRLRGWMVAIAVGGDRLVIQRLRRGREFAAEGEPLSIEPGEIASARAGGAGTWGASPSAAIMDRAAIELKIRTTGGRRVKLMLMREGAVLGGGGEIQAQGVEALARWFDQRKLMP